MGEDRFGEGWPTYVQCLSFSVVWVCILIQLRCGWALIDGTAKETSLLKAAGGCMDHGINMVSRRLDPENEPFPILILCSVIMSQSACPRLDLCEIQAAVYQVDLSTTIMFRPPAVLPPQQGKQWLEMAAPDREAAPHDGPVLWAYQAVIGWGVPVVARSFVCHGHCPMPVTTTGSL